MLVKKLQKELEDMKRALAEAKAGGGGGQGGGDGLGRRACGNDCIITFIVSTTFCVCRFSRFACR